MARRAYGSGSIIERRGDYYGKWRVDGRQVFRRIGPKRTRGEADGLTKSQAETRLREMMAEVEGADVKLAASHKRRAHHYTVAELGALFVENARDHRGLKSTTLTDYEMHVRMHLAPFFGDLSIQRIDARRIEAFAKHLREKKGQGRRGGKPLSPKTIRNYLGTLSALLNFAARKKWIAASPMSAVDLPTMTTEAPLEELTFLETAEVATRRGGGPGCLSDVGSCALHHGRLHGPSSGRATRAVVVARRHRALCSACPGERHARPAVEPEGQAAALRAAGADGGAGASGAARVERVDDRRRSGVRVPVDGAADGAGWPHGPLPRRPRGGEAHADVLVPRPSPHVRNDDGAAGRARRDHPGVDGHADLATTQLYMHNGPAAQDAALIEAAFGPATNLDTNLRVVGRTELTSEAV
jgi:hypothetical protein